LDFSIGGWNANLGLIVSPIEELNLAAVFKTPFEADVKLRKSRRDTWEEEEFGSTVTANAYRSDDVRLEFPSSLGFGVSWRPRDTLTLSADLTQTDWSESRITDYFSLGATPPGAAARDPDVYDELPYPTLSPRIEQEDAIQVRVGVEYVLIAGRLKVPFRAGYFSDRQIEPNASGETPRYNGLTVGTGVILGSLLLDVAYLREFGEVKTQRLFASLIYRYGGRP
jgi:long-subunit fatty acid transport protein